MWWPLLRNRFHRAYLPQWEQISNPTKMPLSRRANARRYTPRTERAVVVLTANADAVPAAQPHKVRLVVRPLTEGKIGEVLSTKTIYLMVIDKP